MKPQDLAVETALIRAGCWWPGAHAWIVAKAAGKLDTVAEKPESLDPLVQELQGAYPEWFLDAEKLAKAAERSGSTFVAKIKAIQAQRDAALSIFQIRRDDAQ